MKQITAFIIVVVFAFQFISLNAQNDPTGFNSPSLKQNGLSEIIFDSYGRQFTMDDIAISEKSPAKAKALETAGIFRLDFVDSVDIEFYDSAYVNHTF